LTERIVNPVCSDCYVLTKLLPDIT
jgi:hypothetical protein